MTTPQHDIDPVQEPGSPATGPEAPQPPQEPVTEPDVEGGNPA